MTEKMKKDKKEQKTSTKKKMEQTNWKRKNEIKKKEWLKALIVINTSITMHFSGTFIVLGVV